MEEAKVLIEREYTIPLRDRFRHTPKHRRVPRAIRTIKEFIAKHMKVTDRNVNNVKLDKFLNEEVWFRGIQFPPARIKVKVKKYDDGIVRVELSELPEILKYKAEREKKREKKVEEVKKEEKPTEKKEEEKKQEKEKEESGHEQELKKAKAESKEKKHEVTDKKMKKQQPRRMVLKK